MKFYGAMIRFGYALAKKTITRWIHSKCILFNFNLIFVLITIGVAGSFLQLTFTYAFKFGEAVVLAPIRYLSVPGAIVVGLIIWSEVPSYFEILGSFITVLSCVIIAWRELIKKVEH